MEIQKEKKAERRRFKFVDTILLVVIIAYIIADVIFVVFFAIHFGNSIDPSLVGFLTIGFIIGTLLSIAPIALPIWLYIKHRKTWLSKYGTIVWAEFDQITLHRRKEVAYYRLVLRWYDESAQKMQYFRCGTPDDIYGPGTIFPVLVDLDDPSVYRVDLKNFRIK